MLKNESITCIEIGNPGNTNRNRLGDEGTIALGTMIQNSLFLQYLDMRGLVMGDRLCIALAKAFQNNFCLMYLNLSKNELTADSINAL